MALLLDIHELVHAYEKVRQVEPQADFQPSFVAAAVNLTVIQRQGEEHNERANSGPHDLKELYPLPLDLLLPPAHLLILEPCSLVPDMVLTYAIKVLMHMRILLPVVQGLLLLLLPHRCGVVVHHHDELILFLLIIN